LFADDIYDNRQAGNALASARGLSSVHIVIADPLDGCLGAPMDGSAADHANFVGTFADGSMVGKIALIRRGGCYFSTKMLNAQNTGAVATVIYNDHRSSAPPISAAGHDEMMNTPALFISGTQGDELNAAVTANPDMTVDIRCEVPAAGGDTACADEGLVAPLAVRHTKPLVLSLSREFRSVFCWHFKTFLRAFQGARILVSTSSSIERGAATVSCGSISGAEAGSGAQDLMCD